MKRTRINLNLLIITLIISFVAINGVFGQEIDFIGKDTTKKKTKKEIRTDKRIYLLPDASLGVGVNRGIILSGGFRLISGTKKIKPQYVGLNFSIPVAGNYTALGAYYKGNFFNGKFGKRLSIGGEVIYFFSADFNSYTEWFFGGKVRSTLGETQTFWSSRRLVFTPKFDFSFSLKKNWKIVINSNPAVIGYWDYFPNQKQKWGPFRRWYDGSITIQKTFPTKSYKNFKSKKIK